MATKLCSACLSTIDVDAESCPQCGTVSRRRSKAGPAVALGVVIAVSVGWWWLSSTSPGQTTELAPTIAATREATPEPEPPPTRHHWMLRDRQGTAVPALALAGPNGQTSLFLPVEWLPLESDLVDAEGSTVPVRVIHYSVEHAFALLTPLVELPVEITPLEPMPAAAVPIGTQLEVSEPTGASGGQVRLASRLPNGRLAPSTAVVDGSVLMLGGRALCYAVSPAEAVPFDQSLSWVDRTGTRELAFVQGELRERLPAPIIAAAASLLEAPSSVANARRAIELLERLDHRVTGETATAVDRWMRQAHHVLVRLLAQESTSEALRTAHNSLARFPDHLGIRSDVILLSLRDDAPTDALQQYLEMRAASRLDAQKVEAQLIAGVIAAARRRTRDQLHTQSCDLLRLAVQLFPDRAELHAAQAEALDAAGRRDQALAAARSAAGLDPTHADLVHRLSAPEQRVHRIAYDPATRSIEAGALVGGEPVGFLVDTGASLTTIPSAVARRLGLWRPDLDMVKVQTAGGEVSAPVVVIPNLVVGPLELTSVRAVLLDLPGSMANKGLLGMNVLGRFDVRLDAGNGVMILEERPEGGR